MPAVAVGNTGRVSLSRKISNPDGMKATVNSVSSTDTGMLANPWMTVQIDSCSCGIHLFRLSCLGLFSTIRMTIVGVALVCETCCLQIK